MGQIYNRSGEKLVLLDIREPLVQHFLAPDWIDLRVGMYLSLTADDDPNTISGLAETISGTPSNIGVVETEDRYFIGVKDRTKVLPTELGTQFIGFTCVRWPRPQASIGDTMLVSSDHGIGTTNANYWRPRNGLSNAQPVYNFAVLDGTMGLGTPQQSLQIHFVQNTTAVPQYAVLLALRIVRSTPDSKRLTITVPTDGVAASDLGYTDTPTKALLRTTLEAWTSNVKTFGPFDFSKVPDSLFVYWPFRQSRLRIHAWGALKAK